MKSTFEFIGPPSILQTTKTQNMMMYQILCGHVNYALGKTRMQVKNTGHCNRAAVSIVMHLSIFYEYQQFFSTPYLFLDTAATSTRRFT
jgi:hypothetical protein